MIIDRKPKPLKAVKVHFLHKVTKKMAATVGMLDGERWRINSPEGFFPVPQHLEVLGWEEK